jgi:hypothetical protein
MKHRETHPGLDVEGCFGCRVAGVSFGANESTTRGAQVKAINQREKGWNRDMPAYKRLRDQGLRPRQIDGAALLESSATEKWQIEGTTVPEAKPVSSES